MSSFVCWWDRPWERPDERRAVGLRPALDPARKRPSDADVGRMVSGQAGRVLPGKKGGRPR